MTTRRTMHRGLLCLLVLLVGGCAGLVSSGAPPGPGVPRIANLRFDPESVKVGETTRMTFNFEVGSADLDSGVVLDQGIAQFQLYTALQTISVDLNRYSGLVAGIAEVPMRWNSEGVRWIEFYVVTLKGNESNRLRATLTVR